MKFLLPLLLLSTYTYVDSMPVRPLEGSPVVHTLYNRLPNLGLKGLKEQIMISAHSESNRDISNDNAPVVSDGVDAPVETIDPARIPVAHAVASSCVNGFQTYADTTWNLMGLPFTIAYTLQACIDICNTAGSTTCAAAVWYNGNACVAYTQAQTAGQTMMASPDPKLPRTLITRCSTSVTQAPVTQAPVTQAPVTQAPVTQAPATKSPVTQAPATQAPPSTCPNGFNTYTDSTYDLMGLSYTVVYTAAGCLSLCSTQSATTCSAAVWYNGNACVMYTQAQATGKVIMKSPDPALPRTLFVRCATITVTPAPVTQAPVTQAPVTQAPATKAPVTQAPATKAPVTQAPVTQAPATQAPVTAAPATSAPVLNPDTSAPGSHGLSYLGGSVMTNPVKVYLVYYGTWTTAQELQGIDIINAFVTNLGTSQWWNIQTTYYFPNPTTGVRSYVQNGVTLGGYVNLPLDANNGGTSLTDAQVSNIVSGAITSGKLPFDNDGVYIMLSSSEVYQNGFCSSDCGWHSAAYVSGTSKIMKYGWVGDASTQCPGSCTGFGSYASPNGNKGADGIISVLAHEIAETVSDPLLSAWRQSDYTENADKCAWNFGQTYLTAAGAKANVKVGSKDYLVQTNWKNRDGGACVLHL